MGGFWRMAGSCPHVLGGCSGSRRIKSEGQVSRISPVTRVYRWVAVGRSVGRRIGRTKWRHTSFLGSIASFSVRATRMTRVPRSEDRPVASEGARRRQVARRIGRWHEVGQREGKV